MSAVAFISAWCFLVGGVVKIASGNIVTGAACLAAGAILADFAWRRAAR